MKAPTTFEMDKLFAQEDIDNRHFVMKPCTKCYEYSKQDLEVGDTPCPYCGGKISMICNYWYSLRTYKKDKKFSTKDKNKLG